jgi:hypothetical protein
VELDKENDWQTDKTNMTPTAQDKNRCIIRTIIMMSGVLCTRANLSGMSEYILLDDKIVVEEEQEE